MQLHWKAYLFFNNKTKESIKIDLKNQQLIGANKNEAAII